MRVTILVRNSTEVLARVIRHQEKKKKKDIRKKEVKLSLFADNIVLYRVVQSKCQTPKKFLDLKNKLSQVSGYKINLCKSVVSTHTQ